MNLDPQTPSGARNRSLLKIILGLASVGIVIGLFTGFLGATAIRAIGFKSTDPPPAPPPATTATASPQSSSQSTEPPSEPATQSAGKKDTKKHRARGTPKLKASPANVSPGERINLSGSFPRMKAGEALQVQRREGGSWEDFPVVARTNSDGSFETWVVTGRSGSMAFRVKAQDSGRKTPPATVQIG